MSEYIERKALRDTLYDADAITMSGVKILNQFPGADVAPVRHGRWLPQVVLGQKAWDCSECKTLGSPHWKWCPVCGAMMDGGADNGCQGKAGGTD